jgi:hypothetical protein
MQANHTIELRIIGKQDQKSVYYIFFHILSQISAQILDPRIWGFWMQEKKYSQ